MKITDLLETLSRRLKLEGYSEGSSKKSDLKTRMPEYVYLFHTRMEIFLLIKKIAEIGWNCFASITQWYVKNPDFGREPSFLTKQDALHKSIKSLIRVMLEISVTIFI